MFKNIIKNKFVKNVLVVATGTAGAQLISIAYTPLITRIFSPEAFGLLGAFMAILTIGTRISAFSYPLAIVLPKDESEAKSLAALSILTSFLLSMVIAIFILIAGNSIAALFNIVEISIYLLLIPMAMFLNTLQEIMQQWLIRNKKFNVTAKVAISQSVIINTAKVFGGLITPSGLVLIVLSVLSSALYATQLWLATFKLNNIKIKLDIKGVSYRQYKELAYKYKDFPLFHTPQMVVNSLSQSIPVLLLIFYFNPAIAGYYAFSRTILAAPAGLISSSVGSVLYPKLAEKFNNGENLHSTFIKATLAMLAIASIPFSIIIFFGPWLFGLVFGQQWVTAGEYAIWMSIWLLSSVVARPAISLFPVLRLQRVHLVYELIFIALKAGSLLIGVYLYDSAIYSIALYSIVSTVFYVQLFLIIFYRTRINVK